MLLDICVLRLTLDSEYHLPPFCTPEVIQGEDCRRQQAAESPSKRSHHDVKTETED